jgi:hypothetical protein
VVAARHARARTNVAQTRIVPLDCAATSGRATYVRPPGASRRRRPVTFLAFALALTIGLACAPPPIADDGYDLVFDEQFDGDELSGIWATAPFGGSLPPGVADGKLTLWTSAANSYNWGYVASTGPHLDSEPNYPFAQAWQEGYFEARIRFSDDPWAWPAFWMMSMASTEARPDEDCGYLRSEWDIMEGGIGNHDGTRPATRSNYSVIHRNTTDGSDDGYCGLADDTRFVRTIADDTDLSDWHVWSGRWVGDELCTFLDNEPRGCLDAYESTAQPMHLVFTIQYARQCGGCGARPPALVLQVDWVRVWK